VHPDYLVGSVGSSGDFGDAELGGVGGKNGVGFYYLVQLVKVSFFSSMISGMASITTSQSAKSLISREV
jgi:hypothetical protein